MSANEKSVAELEAQFIRGTNAAIDAVVGLSGKGALGRLDELWRRMTEYVNFMSGVLEKNK